MSKDGQTLNKGGRSALIKLIRRLDKYEEWKRAVFIRDRFACQKCGKRNGKKLIIEADHIKSLAELIRENGIETVNQAKECALLWDVSNGRTLCHTCHEQTESFPANFRGVNVKKRKQGANY